MLGGLFVCACPFSQNRCPLLRDMLWDQLMRRTTITVTVCLVAGIFWLMACGTQDSAGTWFSQPRDNDPFVFGMTKDEVARVADAPLIYLSGSRGSERYLIERRAS